MLSGSTGNLLEDEATIGIITEAKQLGNDIAEKQVQHTAEHAPGKHRPHVIRQHPPWSRHAKETR